ncbi:unnamed protein product [Menidia menidia]|uniref:(Atlantic silverside) hypothetical protein n=1 Tax=Menidia menidia TaxID=238744 RepID=A0A8S4B8X5_9TELE|nr:unnamed protein product [Menidia menidia]
MPEDGAEPQPIRCGSSPFDVADCAFHWIKSPNTHGPDFALDSHSCEDFCHSSGTGVTEWGDDVRPISEEEAMVIVNHQSTGDVCTLMMCLQDKGTVVRKMMWLMDHVFKYTNFGLVSLIHGDFFIRQGKAHRDKQLVYLKDHLDKYYHNRDRKWIVLFPEGGFLRKRRETSQLFAKKHSLPHLTHVTLPRLGATHVILKTLSAQQENGDAGTPNQTANKRKGLQWVIDMTIAYPAARPMDIQTWIFGYRPPTVTHVHYRMYPIKEVPVEAEALTDWLYQRFVEKEELLAHFYNTGSFPPPDGQKEAASRQMILDPVWLCVIQSFAFASGYIWYSRRRGESLYRTTGRSLGIGWCVAPVSRSPPTMVECTFATVERLNRKQLEERRKKKKSTNNHPNPNATRSLQWPLGVTAHSSLSHFDVYTSSYM